jgi:hypothetical protein
MSRKKSTICVLTKANPLHGCKEQGNDLQAVVLISAALYLPAFSQKKRIPHIVVRSFIKNPRYFQKTKYHRTTDKLRLSKLCLEYIYH